LDKVEKARVKDVPQMQRLINLFAARGEMLARSMSELYENTRDFYVYRRGELVVACAALHIDWEDLAEIKSLAVAEDSQKTGIGTQLVKACLDEARELGIATVYCLTYQPAFFERFGFKLREKSELSPKVWMECYRCPKFPDCDEVALVYEMEL
jgi:amino-acid N-acetyltransferase